MGSRYTNQAIANYNQNPPPSDGSQTANNQLGWDKHLSKIGNPLKALAEAINAALLSALDTSCRVITSSDPTVAGDHLRTVEIAFTVTASITVSLADAATMGNGYIVSVSNQSEVSCAIGTVGVEDLVEGILIGQSPYNIIPPHCTITFCVNEEETGYIVLSSNNFSAWKTPIFDAGNFTADSSMSWAVGSGDVGTYSYKIDGNTITINFFLFATSIEGTPSTDLRIAIPGGKIAAKEVYDDFRYWDNGTTEGVGSMMVAENGTYITLRRTQFSNANWSAATNTTRVMGCFEFEIK